MITMRGPDVYCHKPPCRANHYIAFGEPGCTCLYHQPRSNAVGIKTLVLNDREAEVVERALRVLADEVDRAPPYIRWCEGSEVMEVVHKHFPAQKPAGAKP